jgi:uncharacterized protein (DUF302 family)
MTRIKMAFGGACALALASLITLPAAADNPRPYPGTMVMKTVHSYKALIGKLDAAVKANKMGLVTRASATVGAKNVLKMDIPGNMVVGVYHPRFAVRMLKASVPAGIEAPIRFYITENADKTATLTYRTPSSIFAPYENADLNAMAKELDAIFAKIAARAVK